jgi:hypothetical protein
MDLKLQKKTLALNRVRKDMPHSGKKGWRAG